MYSGYPSPGTTIHVIARGGGSAKPGPKSSDDERLLRYSRDLSTTLSIFAVKSGMPVWFHTMLHAPYNYTLWCGCLEQTWTRSSGGEEIFKHYRIRTWYEVRAGSISGKGLSADGSKVLLAWTACANLGNDILVTPSDMAYRHPAPIDT